jgi:predicted metal-dependent phosphoesterase TrpH
MRFDLHLHSTCSDGHATVKEILKIAAKRGLDGLAITDHDTLRGSFDAVRINRELRLGLIIIPGAEVTTSEGHLLVFGIHDLPSRGLSPEETIELVHDQGGITDVPHPYHPFRHAMWRVPDADAVEVYNSKHLFGLANARAQLEASLRHLPKVAGSDSHYADTIGLGVTCIEGVDVEEVLRAVRLGRTRICGCRTPPKYFIGNTFQSIRHELSKGLMACSSVSRRRIR